MKSKAYSGRQQTQNYALDLLEFRPRSRRELRMRLSAKGFDDKDIDEVLSFLEEKKFIKKEERSEAEAAAELARQRFAKFKNITPDKARNRVYAYLARRGFSDEVITEAIERLT